MHRMKIKLYDIVKLVSGETACIVHIYEQGVAYEADIDTLNGKTLTDTIFQEQIASVIGCK